MLMTLPISRVLEICVNLFFAAESVVDAFLGGTAGGIFITEVTAFWSPVSGDGC